MKKNILLTACMVAFACACQPQASTQDKKDDQNYHDRRAQKPQAGCCETNKAQPAPAQAAQPAQVVQPTPAIPPAPAAQPVQQNQTVATPEVKAEKAK